MDNERNFKLVIGALLVVILVLGSINFQHRREFQNNVISSHAIQEHILHKEILEKTKDRFTGAEGNDLERRLNAKIVANAAAIAALRRALAAPAE